MYNLQKARLGVDDSIEYVYQDENGNEHINKCQLSNMELDLLNIRMEHDDWLTKVQSIDRLARTVTKPNALEMQLANMNDNEVYKKERYMNYFNQPHMLYNPIKDLQKEWLELMKEDTKVENTNWEFHSSAEADINWKDIKDSLTYAEPLAIVTRSYRDYVEKDTYVVVSKQLMDKAHTVGMLEDTPDITATVEKRVFHTEVNFSEWVAWAKAVKAASWGEPIKSTLSVVLPTV